jgi:hypothetical protein
LQPVTEIATEGNNAAVSGLKAGDVVAITGFDKIQDATQVTVLGPPSSERGTGSGIQ